MAGHGADPRDRLQQLCPGLQLLVLVDQGGDPFVEQGELPIIEPDRLADQPPQFGVGRGRQAVLLLHVHVLHLTSSGCEILQLLQGLGERRRRPRLQRAAELGDGAGVDRIRLRQPAEGPCEVTDLPRIDDGHVPAMLMQLLQQTTFEASGGFEADEPWLMLFEERHQPPQPADVYGQERTFE